MDKEQFREKYFTNNFYWVNKDNYKKLQEIGMEFDCRCHSGKGIIEWHDGFKCLGFRIYSWSHGVTIFQKEPFLLESEIATSYEDMLRDYETLIP